MMQFNPIPRTGTLRPPPAGQYRKVALRWCGVGSLWASDIPVKGDKLAPFSRCEAALPRAVTNRPDGPLPAAMASVPCNGAR